MLVNNRKKYRNKNGARWLSRAPPPLRSWLRKLSQGSSANYAIYRYTTLILGQLAHYGFKYMPPTHEANDGSSPLRVRIPYGPAFVKILLHLHSASVATKQENKQTREWHIQAGISVVICPIAIAYSYGTDNKIGLRLSVCLSVRMSSLSRSHFFVDFHQIRHRGVNPQK